MNDADLEAKVLELFLQVAPDVDAALLDRQVPFRDQFDFDSMDTLNFAVTLHRTFAVEIPETDYRHLASLAQSVRYIREQLAAVPHGGTP
jgi:acyl carrier protein